VSSGSSSGRVATYKQVYGFSRIALCVIYILVNLATEPEKTGCNWRPKLKSRWLYKYLRVFTITTLTLNLFAVWIKINKKALLIVVDAKRMQEAPEGGSGYHHTQRLYSCKAAFRILITIARFAPFHGCILGEQRDFIRSFLVY
jgi:hypothetical protein